jgi:hypothetical protein
MNEQTIPAKVPWYELDRMIIESLEPDEWERTIRILNSVRFRCDARGWPMSEIEIIDRLWKLVKMGTLAMTGDIWHQPALSAVCLLISD